MRAGYSVAAFCRVSSPSSEAAQAGCCRRQDWVRGPPEWWQFLCNSFCPSIFSHHSRAHNRSGYRWAHWQRAGTSIFHIRVDGFLVPGESRNCLPSTTDGKAGRQSPDSSEKLPDRCLNLSEIKEGQRHLNVMPPEIPASRH